MPRGRRALDWVVRPEAWGTSFEFSGGATETAFVPLTVWQTSLAGLGNAPPQVSGLFESGSALTVERVRLRSFIIPRRIGDAQRLWNHTLRLRVGEGNVADVVDVEQPVEPPGYDVNLPEWANEDFLWEDSRIISTERVADTNFEGVPMFLRMDADVRTRRRLEVPDQLQLVIQRDFDGQIVPAQPLESTVIIYVRVLLSQAM